ncbi:DUF3077 domain-containing protein [Pseudomonas sp. CCI1.2]|uniref:DUF3077 domain-containing protein n=1 Tax=Pseudomonas sp. CCI1.2 TaxID=3048614 RepID=UPI002B2231C4|nr:DUF3077 domain-containing protein [Pseudomonas sp. CCI1.2]MEB0119211.1 DUF3077 domain-containing protein [Pseudomonas sp. CCI1.2]
MSKPLKTTAVTFASCGDVSKNQKIFSVNAAVGAEGALNACSDLLEIVMDSVMDACMGERELTGGQAWLVHNSIQSAKAIVDALWATYQLDSPDPVEA